jgi:small multidrug resistance family-3 protein
MVEPLASNTNIIIITLVLFFVAALMEIGGGYLVWQWLREKKEILIGLTGIILFRYGMIPTFQPSHFGRTYAACGGIFITSSIIWGIIVDKKKPDRFEIIGSLIAVCGAVMIFYTPR